MILRDKGLSLRLSQTKELAFFMRGKTLELFKSSFKFFLENREERIIVIGHLSLSDTLEGGFKTLFSNIGSLRSINGIINFLN